MLQSCNVLLLLLYLGCTTSYRSHRMSPSTAGALGPPSLFPESPWYWPGMLKDQDTVDQESSLLQNVKAQETRSQDVIDAETSGLETIFHNSQSIKISGVTECGLSTSTVITKIDKWNINGTTEGLLPLHMMQIHDFWYYQNTKFIHGQRTVSGLLENQT